MLDRAAPLLQWTATDIAVGARLVAALFTHAASSGAPIAAADLLGLARSAHPRDAQLARAVVLGIAPKLQFVAAFCQRHGYPNLAGLVDGAAAQPFDWQNAASGYPAQLAAFVKTAQAAVPVRFKARAERPADVAWYAYFRTHRAACDALSSEGKKEIINLMMAGLDPDAALARVLAAQAQQN
ncbi:hypothetical protein [Massilia sp. S19_KUP03_FR1]|uniref:hypothetical protein n=1 Tax=Massilia sp. S19_KUP03_FR1 TaxID=3025503 RepID=UPI002FCDB1DF